jgi:hypothetical protein
MFRQGLGPRVLYFPGDSCPAAASAYFLYLLTLSDTSFVCCHAQGTLCHDVTKSLEILCRPAHLFLSGAMMHGTNTTWASLRDKLLKAHE